jgi:ABC-2 type transport system ATP-binding protein
VSSGERGLRIRVLAAGYGGFRRRQVLNGIDLDARPGEVTALVGPNGVGKTTLFRVLSGFLSPWSGEVAVDGLPPRENRRRNGVAYLPETVALPAGFTLIGLLTEGARLGGLRGGEASAAIAEVLAESGLGDSADRLLTSYSKGMGRRAALAYALLGNPSLVLLDEPMSGLDPRARTRLRAAIDRVRERRATIVVASHELLDVQRSADVAFVLDGGRVIRRVEGDELATANLERIVLDAEPAP